MQAGQPATRVLNIEQLRLLSSRRQAMETLSRKDAAQRDAPIHDE